MSEKLTKDEVTFLKGVRDDCDVFPIIREIGYGWAVERGFVRHVGPMSSLDFQITPAGRATLNETTK